MPSLETVQYVFYSIGILAAVVSLFSYIRNRRSKRSVYRKGTYYAPSKNYKKKNKKTTRK